jgi:hypothetical protein
MIKKLAVFFVALIYCGLVVAQPTESRLFTLIFKADSFITKEGGKMKITMLPKVNNSIGVVIDSGCILMPVNMQLQKLEPVTKKENKKTYSIQAKRYWFRFEYNGKTKELILENFEQGYQFFMGPLDFKKRNETITIPKKFTMHQVKQAKGYCERFIGIDVSVLRK